MKKILSILVIAAMLLAALCVSTSAAFFERNDGAINYKDAKIQVKKSYVVKIDGVISDGEYEEYTEYCEWWVGEMASDAYNDAANMAHTIKWYFSWDGNKYFNVAAVFDAGVGATQKHPGGNLFGDYNAKEADESYEFVNADDFLAYGPGLQVISNEVSAKYTEWARLCYAVGKSDVDGGYITGTFSDQNGQPESPYNAVGGQDFEVSKNGTVVTIEWRIPIYQLKADFVEGSATTNFKCSLTAGAGVTEGPAEGEEAEFSGAPYNYGVRLGMLGFNADSSLEDKGHATFVLGKNEIPYNGGDDTTSGGGDDTTSGGDDTTIGGGDDTTIGGGDDTTIGGGEDTTIGGGDDTTIGGGNDDTTTGGNNDPAEKPGENKPADNQPADKPANNQPNNKPNNNVNASVTADPMVIAAVVSAISACGVMIAKKRK